MYSDIWLISVHVNVLEIISTMIVGFKWDNSIYEIVKTSDISQSSITCILGIPNG